jgi:hypothetical protein
MWLHSRKEHRIRFKLKESYPEYLVGRGTGIYHPQNWTIAKLCEADEIGIWVENPNYAYTPYEDEEGNEIPRSERREVIDSAILLIRWEDIASILCFEGDQRGRDRQSARLGFRLPESESDGD